MVRVHAALQGGVTTARAGHSGEIALDVGGKDRDTHATECLGHVLQRASLARACGTGDEAMPISHLREKADVAPSRSYGYACSVLVVKHEVMDCYK